MLSNDESTIDRPVFAVRFKRLRKEKKMTQEETALELGVSRASVISWENGKRFPSIESSERAAKLFSVPSDYLCGRSNKRYKIIQPDYFEFDFSKLNSEGIGLMSELYDLLLLSDKYTKVTKNS